MTRDIDLIKIYAFYNLTYCQALWHSRVKRPLASSCPSVCLPVRPSLLMLARLPLDAFPRNLILVTLRKYVMEICVETPDLFVMWQKYGSLYIKTKVRFIVVGYINST